MLYSQRAIVRSVLPALLAVATALTPHASGASADEHNALFHHAVDLFFDAKPKESVAAFDQLIEKVPQISAHLWQRGLALYYAGEFAKGREQFELHKTVNPNDVENAAWHFFCVAKAEGADAARKALIPITGDGRIPMKELHDLFAGTGNEEAVMKAAQNGQAGSEALVSQLYYAHLYLGLYHEALGHTALAKEHMLKAVNDYSADDYMGKVAGVHVKLRGWGDGK